MSESPTILIVDDVAIVRHLAARALAQLAPAPVLLYASNVAEGRRVLSQGLTTLLLTDLYLPDGTGLDLLRAAQEQSSAIPVVVMSTDHTIANEAEAAGAAAFVAKPFDVPQLRNVVQRLVLPTAFAQS